MKIFQKALMAMAMSSSMVMAQDYYAPTDKEKEPVARFPLEEIRIQTINGEKVIKYELPATLTGEVNRIEAKEVKIPGLNNLPNSVRVFAGDNATVTCMGTDDKPGCMVTHRNLNLDKDLAYAAINEEYFDPQLRINARSVVDEFHGPVEHSGNQPIGILGGLKPRESKANLPFTGTWITKYELPNGKLVFAKVTLRRTNDGFGGEYWYNATIPTGSGSDTWENKDKGTFSDVRYFGNRVIGRWAAGGSSPGWFEFTFSAAKTRFEGYYGIKGPGSDRAGRWTSLSLQ